MEDAAEYYWKTVLRLVQAEPRTLDLLRHCQVLIPARCATFSFHAPQKYVDYFKWLAGTLRIDPLILGVRLVKLGVDLQWRELGNGSLIVEEEYIAKARFCVIAECSSIH